ncbi:MAG: 3-hydroxyacyl-CoA dehydrogenase NAD-binding domain-containing protein [Mariprofundaceae bacterium]
MEVVRLVRDGDTARLVFGRQDKSVNVLDETCIQALEGLLDELEKQPPRTLVLESTMPGCFIAGADLDIIAAVKDANEAEILAERGQAICRRIEDLSAVSIAVVHGACMGGGLEVAMACDHILAVQDAKTKLALPEIKIGIHPGFGGCVRLPKRVGWTKAVDMILTGRAVDANKARRMGLASVACHGEEIEAGIEYLARKGKVERVGVKPVWLRLWPARAIFFHFVRKRAFARFKHLDLEKAYPSVPATISLLQELIGMSDGLAYAREAESLGKMAVTSTCKNLIGVFRLGEALKKQAAVRQGKQVVQNIGHVSIFGAGVMGSGIAWVASKSADVDMHDVAEDSISRGMKNIAKFARRDTRRMGRIRPVPDKSGLARSDVVIEAVLEEMEVKKALWAEVEQSVGETALLLTNTSSLSVSEMQASCKHPGRVAGMHFFNPAPKMPLVEVVAGKKTAAATIHAVCALTVRWGKFPVVVADRPGFLVNRCLMPFMASALRLIESGQSIEHVDGALKNFGMPMGALELADQVGLDICMHVGNQLARELGGQFSLPEWLTRMVDDGLLGMKSGKGFFLFEKGKAKGVNPDLENYGLRVKKATGSDANIGAAAAAMSDEAIIEACLLPMLCEALACLGEGVVKQADHLDAAMVYGIGFPPFRGGLLRYFSTTCDQDALAARISSAGLNVPENLEVLYG